HREDHDRSERRGAGTGVDRRNRPDMDERDHNGHHKDIEHRPAADPFNKTVEFCALLRTPARAPLCCDGQEGKRDAFHYRDHHARGKDDCGDERRPSGPEQHDPAHDGILLRAEYGTSLGHRQYVCGDVEDQGRNEEGPGSADTVPFTEPGRAETTRASCLKGGSDAPTQRPTRAAHHEPLVGRGHHAGLPASSSARSQRWRGSNIRMAASNSVSAAKAHKATPGRILAVLDSFTSDTSTPNRNTSIIPHGRMVCMTRAKKWNRAGSRPCLRGMNR